MKVRSIFAGLLGAALFAAVSALPAHATLYGISPRDNVLRIVDPLTGATTSAAAITSSLGTVKGGTGLATNPLTNELYGLLKIGSSRVVAIIDPLTGVATVIGDPGDLFAGLTFDSAGTLYGVSSESAFTPESLFILDTATAATTFVLTLGNGDGGEAIAFNPDDGLIYHASGLDEGTTAVVEAIFETIDPVTLAIVNIGLAGDVINNSIAALVYADGGLLAAVHNRDNGPSYAYEFGALTTGGIYTGIGDQTTTLKGLAFVVDAVAAIPEPGSLALFAAGLAGMGAIRRRRRSRRS